MSEKDLRTKITELPLCEDEELIDTLIAIGTDGKTYRVEGKNVIGGSSTCEPLKYTSSNRGAFIQYAQNLTMAQQLTKGGFLHFIINISNANIDIPILFDEDNMLSYTTYDDLPVYVFDHSTVFHNDAKKEFQILQIWGSITRAHFSWNDRGLDLRIAILDYTTKEEDQDTTLVVSNVYFEPKSIPATQRIKKD